MEAKELLKQELGAEGEFEVKYEEGKLRLVLGVDTKGVDGGLFVDFEPSYFLDKLKKAIPGEIDDKIIDMLKAGFGI